MLRYFDIIFGFVHILVVFIYGEQQAVNAINWRKS